MLTLLTSLVFLSLLYYVLRYLWELIPVGDLRHKAVFITGCDSGFGKLLAIKCAKNGIPTFAGCLTDEGFKNLQNETRDFPGKCHAVKVDVTSDESVFEAFEYVKTNLDTSERLWAIVNNAGIVASYCPEEWTTIDQFRRVFEVNTLGIVRCVHAFLPLLKESKGRILATASVMGRVIYPYNSTYAISKYGVEAYMDVLRLELKQWGIKCCIFEPGVFKTSLVTDLKLWQNLIDKQWERLPEKTKNDYGEVFKKDLMTSYVNGHFSVASTRLDYVVDAYYHAIVAKFPRLRYRCGWDAIFYYIPLSFLPTELQDWVSSNFRGALIGTLPAALRKKKN